MKFKRTMQAKCTVKKMKEYTFPDIPKEIMEKGREHDYNNKLIYVTEKRKDVWGLYQDIKGSLVMVMYHTYDCFEPIDLDNSKQKQLNGE